MAPRKLISGQQHLNDEPHGYQTVRSVDIIGILWSTFLIGEFGLGISWESYGCSEGRALKLMKVSQNQLCPPQQWKDNNYITFTCICSKHPMQFFNILACMVFYNDHKNVTVAFFIQFIGLKNSQLLQNAVRSQQQSMCNWWANTIASIHSDVLTIVSSRKLIIQTLWALLVNLAPFPYTRHTF